MFIEIHNALVTQLRAAPYRRFAVAAKTDLAESGDLVVPQAVIARLTYSAYQPAAMRREMALELSQQTWQTVVELPGLIDFSEAEEFLSSPIRVELETGRTLLVVLQSGHYNTPPTQSPASGSQATFTFQTFAPFLRK